MKNVYIGNSAIGNSAIGNRVYRNEVRLRGLRREQRMCNRRFLQPAQAGFVCVGAISIAKIRAEIRGNSAIGNRIYRNEVRLRGLGVVLEINSHSEIIDC